VAAIQGRSGEADVFAFYSNRLGCMGSLAVSLVVTALLLLLVRAL
jgi:hypothetical protein